MTLRKQKQIIQKILMKFKKANHPFYEFLDAYEFEKPPIFLSMNISRSYPNFYAAYRLSNGKIYFNKIKWKTLTEEQFISLYLHELAHAYVCIELNDCTDKEMYSHSVDWFKTFWKMLESYYGKTKGIINILIQIGMYIFEYSDSDTYYLEPISKYEIDSDGIKEVLVNELWPNHINDSLFDGKYDSQAVFSWIFDEIFNLSLKSLKTSNKDKRTLK